MNRKRRIGDKFQKDGSQLWKVTLQSWNPVLDETKQERGRFPDGGLLSLDGAFLSEKKNNIGRD